MTKNTPILVGITGGIGAGKSTAAKIFNTLGIPIYYADERAKWLMENDNNLISGIKNAFGNNSYLENGKLNKPFLAGEVFSDLEKTKIINDLVHPAVKRDFQDWAAQQKSPYVLKEAALLFESGSYKELDKVIHVSSPLKIRMNRILFRDPHRTEEQVNAIIDRQYADEKKNKMADYIIRNKENKMLIPQVLDIHEKLLLELSV
ncbi:dephospho-CoA kinase [Echinicola jeungdonensis]|uniref:Dephospho-CoA kinase n=1 Tax=Echinicola jeungdonensis TaxID=709343 RepID=A0ABV5J575_9BACT|nr:dephospho-CoA kinase [Echinicola jeungdonensis]MDN3668667.1 dephospho-CoA kinase [Echinicola jeungdonensis]